MSLLPSAILHQVSKHQCLTLSLNVRSACDVVAHFLRHNHDMKLNTHLKKYESSTFFMLSLRYKRRLHVTCTGGRWG